MYEITLYLLAGAIVLLGWSCARLFPKIPNSGGLQGVRFWLGMVLVVGLDRVLNTAFFTVETSLYDQPDAVRAFIGAALLYGMTSAALRRPTMQPHQPD